ncbi:monooxygenase [Mycolicibacterium setense]|uniref:flavin-containing monooxygenase n=1 Tax=Mycolicibacterium setense TaxID=431269 RepID=UPI0007EBD21A|nr:NAD(P)/FAD-dependent oxidoreductase [Mycolicibacterium setense]OBB14635.1 monooxygenase [Mycolicibacterium setense]
MAPTDGAHVDDLEAARQRYRAERDKRLRNDGIDQYQKMEGRFASWLADPYADPGFSRLPVKADNDVVIIGAGIGALVCAHHLRDAGVTDIRVIDTGGDFGGAWYWNRYPGVMCDVESYIYLPLLEETGYVPSRKYTDGQEIREHLQRAARHLGLYEQALMQTTVTGAAWDEALSRWVITSNRGDVVRARFLIIPTGQLLKPKLPGIPGIETFSGHMFHTSRWDYDYTGGTSIGGLDLLRDKRVGVLGTGATAVQCIPHLAESAQQLYVFQRTPSAVDYRNNKPTEPSFSAGCTPGWQRRRRQNFTSIISGQQTDHDLVGDGWTAMFSALTSGSLLKDRPNLTSKERAQILEKADLDVMNAIRARIDETVTDRATAERLKPWYGRWCKRPLFHDEYLPAFNLPNTTLVDTDGRGPDQIDESAVIVAGTRYEVDCLVFATGFEVGTSYAERVGFDPVGRGGLTISEKWAKGPETLHGIQCHGFPNAFFTNTNHAPRTANYTHLADEQARHMAYVIASAGQRGANVVEVTAAGERDWGEEVARGAHRGARYRAECTPGFLNGEGNSDDARNGIYAGTYADGPVKFFSILEEWRAAGDLAGLELRSPTTPESSESAVRSEQ